MQSLLIAVHFVANSLVYRLRGLQMAAQTHVQGDRNAHHDQRTHTQDQEPPDHSHSRLE